MRFERVPGLTADFGSGSVDGPSCGAGPKPDPLFEQAACGLLRTRVDGTIVCVNATFCDWIGRAAGELVEKRRLQDLFTMGGRLFHQTHWAPLMQIQGSVAELKIDVVHGDGSSVPMLFNAVRRRNADGVHDDLAAMVLRDRHLYERELLAARREAEAARELLTDADRRKDAFLATLSHELRNPLAPLRNVVQILKMLPLDDPKLVWSRDVLERQVGQLSHLVDDLLEASRIANGKPDLRRERVDLAQPLQVAIESVQPIVDAANHRLIVTLSSQPVIAEVDPTRVAQMVLNLLANAARYTPEGGEIRLDLSSDGNEAVVRVSDNGEGIDADDLSRVFDMFAQLEDGASRREGGLGIGLALVHGLTRLHGGSVDAQSGGRGRGCTFTIRLPLAAPDAR